MHNTNIDHKSWHRFQNVYLNYHQLKFEEAWDTRKQNNNYFYFCFTLIILITDTMEKSSSSL
jgi:hypothetical protein